MKQKQSTTKLIASIIVSTTIIFVAFSCTPKANDINSIAWLKDSLNITGQNVSSIWIDSTKTNFAFALYRKDTSLLRIVSLDDRVIINENVIIADQPNGTVKISFPDPFDYNGEYYVVNQGILEMYNKEDVIFSKAYRLPRTK